MRTASRPSPPVRTCVGCRTARPKRELVRLVSLSPVSAAVDLTGKASGRGAYLCPDPACWTLAERRRAVERALSVKLDPAAWQNLLASRPAPAPLPPAES